MFNFDVLSMKLPCSFEFEQTNKYNCKHNTLSAFQLRNPFNTKPIRHTFGWTNILIAAKAISIRLFRVLAASLTTTKNRKKKKNRAMHAPGSDLMLVDLNIAYWFGLIGALCFGFAWSWWKNRYRSRIKRSSSSSMRVSIFTCVCVFIKCTSMWIS